MTLKELAELILVNKGIIFLEKEDWFNLKMEVEEATSEVDVVYIEDLKNTFTYSTGNVFCIKNLLFLEMA